MTKNLDANWLSKTHTFKNLSNKAINAIIDNSTIITLQSGETIFTIGKQYDKAVYILYDGEVELHRANGKIIKQGAGSIFGISNYLDKESYSSTVIATHTSILLRLNEDILQQLESEHVSLFSTINTIISQRIINRRELRRVISGLMAQPVTEIMQSPIVNCAADLTVKQTYQLMKQRHIDVIGVYNSNQTFLGLIRYQDICHALINKNLKTSDLISKAITDKPLSITFNTPVWQAEELQQRHADKHLLVIENEQAIGIVSEIEILSATANQQNRVFIELQSAYTIDDLQEIYSRIPTAANNVWLYNRNVYFAVQFISHFHVEIQRRCIELTLHSLEDKGLGKPPRAFAIINFAAAARGEMLLQPEQANGIIIADYNNALTDHENSWFHNFANQLVKNLQYIGYATNADNILVSNPVYCKTLQSWINAFTHFAKTPNETNLKSQWPHKTLDFNTLYGEVSLTRHFRNEVLLHYQPNSNIFKSLLETNKQNSPNIAYFSRFISDIPNDRQGKIDINRYALSIVVDITRVLSLHTGIIAQNTFQRLRALTKHGIINSDFADIIYLAYSEFYDLLIAHQFNRVNLKNNPDTLIDPQTMSSQTKSTLRMSFRALIRYQQFLDTHYPQ